MAGFGWAASQMGAGGMGASFDITDDNPTYICPLPVVPNKPKAIVTLAISYLVNEGRIDKLLK